jgi:hypothetical protein
MSDINNASAPDINRGVELILRRRRPKPKTFSFNFEKMVSFFTRNVTISFNFSLDIRKHNQ